MEIRHAFDLWMAVCIVACAAACQSPEDLFAGIPSDENPIVVEAGAVSPEDNRGEVEATIRPSEGDVSFVAPETWEQRPPSNSMRVAEWSLPGDAVCALFTFPGGGAVDANFERWLGQFTQPDGGDSTDAARRMSMDVRGISVEFLQVSGTYHTSNAMMNGAGETLPGYALFGAVFSTSPAPYFLKCTGPEPSIQEQAIPFTNFVASFEFR